MFHEGTFAQIISLDNLFLAWKNYRKGKRSKPDIQEFEFRLEDKVFQLHEDLENGIYRPGGYQQFRITDPKSRMISKAPVRDRLLHQAIYQRLYTAFDKIFIFDSYSCRDSKGTHKAFERVAVFSREVSGNYTRPCWAIKMDIKKFFDSIDHEVLLELLRERLADERLLQLLKLIIESFHFSSGKGMPLGNLTSQLFANVYMDPLDKFVNHELRIKYYLRYADDFVILSTDPDYLLGCLVELNLFLKERLKLQIHPNKVSLRKLSQGIDFVGYIALPRYSLPRRKTVKRMLKRLKTDLAEDIEKALPSYLGHIGHADSHKLTQKVKEIAPRL
ncbi:MAG: reverse transcriptase/maturase family protein [Candidatus Berkelbacteria bacterium]|nr:reverse transcriptase/maturase family protein [Candidatus Berkelbacteria bacterium]